MNSKHLAGSSSGTVTESGRTHSSRKGEAGGVTGSKTPTPQAYALDEDGNLLPASKYDRSKRHIYVGPHHPCSRCLVRQIPLPEKTCSFCATPIAPQVSL